MVFTATLSSSFTSAPSSSSRYSLSATSSYCAFPPRRFATPRMGPSPAQAQAQSKEAKLWGGRFKEGVTDAVERFTESISFDKQLYKQDIKGSRAHASMLAHQVCHEIFHSSNSTLGETLTVLCLGFDKRERQRLHSRRFGGNREAH